MQQPVTPPPTITVLGAAVAIADVLVLMMDVVKPNRARRIFACFILRYFHSGYRFLNKISTNKPALD